MDLDLTSQYLFGNKSEPWSYSRSFANVRPICYVADARLSGTPEISHVIEIQRSPYGRIIRLTQLPNSLCSVNM